MQIKRIGVSIQGVVELVEIPNIWNLMLGIWDFIDSVNGYELAIYVKDAKHDGSV